MKEYLPRHPKCCKFLRDYGYCNFGEWCVFSHKSFGKKSDVQNKVLKELAGRFEKLEKEINTTDEVITNLEI